MIKTLNKFGVRETYLNILVICDKPIANIILNIASFESFSSKIRNKTRILTLTIPIQHTSGSPCQSSQARKENKRHPIQKRRNKIVSVLR